MTLVKSTEIESPAQNKMHPAFKKVSDKKNIKVQKARRSRLKRVLLHANQKKKKKKVNDEIIAREGARDHNS